MGHQTSKISNVCKLCVWWHFCFHKGVSVVYVLLKDLGNIIFRMLKNWSSNGHCFQQANNQSINQVGIFQVSIYVVVVTGSQMYSIILAITRNSMSVACPVEGGSPQKLDTNEVVFFRSKRKFLIRV